MVWKNVISTENIDLCMIKSAAEKFIDGTEKYLLSYA